MSEVTPKLAGTGPVTSDPRVSSDTIDPLSGHHSIAHLGSPPWGEGGIKRRRAHFCVAPNTGHMGTIGSFGIRVRLKIKTSQITQNVCVVLGKFAKTGH